MVSTLLWAVLKGGDTLQVIAASLPDISGEISAVRFNPGRPQQPTGCFSNSIYNIDGETLNLPNVSASNNSASSIIAFKASDGNNIYGASDIVQPPALALIPQLKF